MDQTNDTTNNTLCDLNIYCEPMEDYYDRLGDDMFPTTGEWVLICVYFITFLVGLVGNSLVCLSIWRNKHMRTVTNMFIVNLSVADLAVILVCLPSTLLVDVTLTWFLGTVFCKIHLFLMMVCVAVSVLTLSAISVERWYAICRPLRFHSTVRRTRIIIIVIWCVSMVIALPELIYSEAVKHYPDHVFFTACYPSLMDRDHVVVFQIFIMVCLYFLPIGLMAITYTHIGLVLMNGPIPGEARTRQPMISGHHHDNEDQQETRKKAAKMLCAIVIVFALCFFPNHLLNILRYTDFLDTIQEHADTFALIAHWLVCLNSCINPVIYNFMSEKFRKEFKQTVGWCLLCKCGRQSEPLRKHDQYKVTFTSTPTLSCRLNSSPTCSTKNSIQDLRSGSTHLNNRSPNCSARNSIQGLTTDGTHLRP